MSDLRTAAKAALWAFQYHVEQTWPIDRSTAAIAALRAALRAALAQQAEPVQEPVAWLQSKTRDAYLRPDLGYETCSKTDYGAFPVYTAPPQRKLTDDQIGRIWFDARIPGLVESDARRLIRAAEAEWNK